MIETDKRKAIYLLHQEGMEDKEIARRLGVSPTSVRTIVQQKGVMPRTIRKDKQAIDPELLRRLHQDCQGRVQRMHEKLVEEHQVQVKYSTLTRMVRELGLGAPVQARCQQVPDEPGLEMQHDTTVYRIELGGQRVRLVASLIYLRYSKRRYLKFFRIFDRFQMKCFFHEALTYWGHAAGQCIIDNTNLARLRGIGQAAVMVPEMAAFAKQYGFLFRCHERGHSNRKAGEERSFWTVETNFLPGRTFQNLEDLNQQALDWSTVRMENRPQTKAGLIPAQVFEHERTFLIALPPHLPPPYKLLQRGTDQYGYITLDANFYWVPGTGRDEVTVLRYADRLKIYKARECLAEYLLPADGVRNGRFSPEGLPPPPHHPNNRRAPTQEEEKRLRAIAASVSAYLDWVLTLKGQGRHRFLRSLLALSRKMSPDLFIKSVERAAKFRIEDIHTIERIALIYLQQGTEILPAVAVDEQFTLREAYLEGSLTEAPDLSIYQDPPEADPPPPSSGHE
jgi:transposase